MPKSYSNYTRTNWVTLAIILFTTFIPSSGSMGMLKLAIVVLLCLFRLGNQLSNSYIALKRKQSQRIIFLWFVSIFLASIAVIVTEGGLNYATIGHEILRVIYYLCVIVLCFSITISLKQLFYACSIIILIHFSVQLSQYLSLGIFDQYIIQYYLSGDMNNQHYLMSMQLYDGGFRSGSIFINPNVYVCYPYLSLGVFLQYYRLNKGKISLIMIAVAFLSIVLTGSRMGMFTYIFIIAWYFFYASKHIQVDESKKRSGSSWAFILGVVILGIFYIDDIMSYSEGMRAFSLESAYETSGSTKFQGLLGYCRLSNPLEWIFGSLGAYRLAIPIDMEWGYIFAWFGIFGFIWYLRLIKLIYCYHRRNYPIISSISAFSIIMTAIGASSVLNMSVFPFICAISFTNILPFKK